MNRLLWFGAFLLLSASASASAAPENRWYWYYAGLSGLQYTHEPSAPTAIA